MHIVRSLGCLLLVGQPALGFRESYRATARTLRLTTIGAESIHKAYVETTPVRVITSEQFALHKCRGRWHPECPERLEVTVGKLEALGSRIVTLVTPSADPSNPNAAAARRAALDAVKRVHDLEYINHVEKVGRR